MTELEKIVTTQYHKLVHADKKLIDSKFKLSIEIVEHDKRVKHRFNWRARKRSLISIHRVYSLLIVSPDGIFYDSSSHLTLSEAINASNEIIAELSKY